MLRNYLKIALRTLRKQRGFAFINIFGLAIGLACCLLITLYVLDELSFDRFHAHASRMYRVHSDLKFGGNDMRFAVSPDPLGPTLLNDYPQVENFARLHERGTWLVRRAGTTNNLREEHIFFADSTVFDVFTFPLVSGDPNRALTEPYTVVISETAARRHFGTQNPLGQVLVFDNDKTFKVTGVMRDIPANSHIQTHFFLAMRSDEYPWGQWLSNNHYTYIRLRPGIDPAQFERNFEAVVEKYVGPQVKEFLGASMDELQKSGNSLRYWLMPLTDIHLHSHQQIELSPNGDMQYVYVFSAVAVFILLIACVNFMNLATARSSGRAREVGVRKVLGSERGQLIGQFMAESVLMATLAMGLAMGLVAACLPFFNVLSAKTLTLSTLVTRDFLILIVLLPLLTGLLAGSYPAFFLSSFQPIAVLKSGSLAGRLHTGMRRFSLRSGLVVFQFITSIVLIVGTIVVYRQLHFIQTTKLGFERAQVLTVNDLYLMGKRAETFKAEVLRLPGVTQGSLSGFLPTPSNRNDNAFFPEGKVDQKTGVNMQFWGVDHDYVKTMGMKIVQGRDFSREFGSDSTAMILNETAAKHLGFKNPLGKRISMYTDLQAKTMKTYTVVGVVKNFHFESLRRNIGSLALVLSPNSGAAVFRLSSNDPAALIRQIETKWKTVAPGQPFSYSFLDDEFDAMYRAEQRVGSLVLTFSVLAILVACLGLFGLAAYMAEQRTKEIGVRKVLGATVPSLVGLLSKDFLTLVFVALLLASPIAWYVMSRWLEEFAYRIDLDWWVFALAGALAVGIALLTVSFQAVKAALMNPVKSLRSE